MNPSSTGLSRRETVQKRLARSAHTPNVVVRRQIQQRGMHKKTQPLRAWLRLSAQELVQFFPMRPAQGQPRPVAQDDGIFPV
ncbi:MAG: hypothetical protein DME21_16820, partial [Verrucomicrobia bacterium]